MNAPISSSVGQWGLSCKSVMNASPFFLWTEWAGVTVPGVFPGTVSG